MQHRAARARDHAVGGCRADDLGRARQLGAGGDRPEGDRRRDRRHRGRRQGGRRRGAGPREGPARAERDRLQDDGADGTRIGTVITNAAGDHALRVWDANSEAIQEFGSIDIVPVQPGVGDHGDVHREPRGHHDGLRAPQGRGCDPRGGHPRRDHVHQGRRRLQPGRVQVRARVAARVRRRDQRRRHLRRRAFPLRGTQRGRHHHARLQPRGAAAVRLQLRLQLPAAAEAEPIRGADRGGREERAEERRFPPAR